MSTSVTGPGVRRAKVSHGDRCQDSLITGTGVKIQSLRGQVSRFGDYWTRCHVSVITGPDVKLVITGQVLSFSHYGPGVKLR